MELHQNMAMRNERFVEQCLKKINNEKDVEIGLRNLLQYLGETLQCDRVYVFENMDRQHIRNTYEWCKEGTPSGIQQLPYVAKKDLFTWYEALSLGDNIIEANVESLKESEPYIYEILTQQHIHSIILSPLINQGEVVGLFGADNPPAENITHISVVLSVLAYFIFSLVNQRELKKLREQKDLAFMNHQQSTKQIKNTVLLLDDSMAILKLNERVLRTMGFQILTANNIQRAKEQIQKHQPDMIIMDIDLPDGNGIDFCRELEGSIPVIFLTARSDEQVARIGLQAGGSAFLTKPYQIEEFQQAVYHSMNIENS